MIQKERLRFVGVVLRKYRKKAKLTQGKLASKLGVSLGFLSRIERGKSFPSIYNLIKIATILDIRPGELLDDIADMEKAYKDNEALPQHNDD